jgi:hypothetical protein
MLRIAASFRLEFSPVQGLDATPLVTVPVTTRRRQASDRHFRRGETEPHHRSMSV